MKRKIILFSTILLFFNFFLFANDEYISVQEASSQLGANLFWDPMTKSGILEKDGNSLAFALNQEIAISNFKDFSVTNAPYMKDDIVYIQRGYERFEEKLRSLGGMIERVSSEKEIQKFKLKVG